MAVPSGPRPIMSHDPHRRQTDSTLDPKIVGPLVAYVALMVVGTLAATTSSSLVLVVPLALVGTVVAAGLTCWAVGRYV